MTRDTPARAGGNGGQVGSLFWSLVDLRMKADARPMLVRLDVGVGIVRERPEDALGTVAKNVAGAGLDAFVPEKMRAAAGSFGSFKCAQFCAQWTLVFLCFAEMARNECTSKIQWK